MHQTFSKLIWNISQWIWSIVSHNTTYFWREIDNIVYSLMLSATPPQKNGVGENDLHDHCTNKTNDSYVQSSKMGTAQKGIYIFKKQLLIVMWLWETNGLDHSHDPDKCNWKHFKFFTNDFFVILNLKERLKSLYSYHIWIIWAMDEKAILHWVCFEWNKN